MSARPFHDKVPSDIPEDWETPRLDDTRISKTVKAGGTPLRTMREFYENGRIRFVRIEDMTRSHKYLGDTESRITPSGLDSSSAWSVPENSILFSMYASFGEVAINRTAVATNQAILAIVPTNQSDLDYLYYALSSLKPKLHKFLRETTQKNLNAEIVKSLGIPFPPPKERQKIGAILSTVDDAILKTDEIIAKSQQLKKGLMQQLLTRGIGHTKFKQTEIGEIPEECECRKVGEVCEAIMGQSPPGNSYNDIGVGLPLLNGPTEFGETTPIPVQWTSQPTKICSSNDVLLCVRGNTTGRINTADREYCIGRGVAAIRAKPGKTDSRFIKYVFQRLEPRILQVAFGAGSTFPNINRDEISSLPIPVPPLAEQLKISEILSGVDEKTARERTRRQHLSRLKNGLMQVLLTGKVRVKVD